MSVSFDWEFRQESQPPRQLADGTPPTNEGHPQLRWGAVVFISLAIVGLAVRACIVSRLKIVDKAEAELRAVVELGWL